MSEEIKPCPFCGSEPKIWYSPNGVACENDDCTISYLVVRLDEWNTRESFTREEVEGLLDVLSGLIRSLSRISLRRGSVAIILDGDMKRLEEAKAKLSEFSKLDINQIPTPSPLKGGEK